MQDMLEVGELRSFPVAFVPTLLLCCGSCGQHLPRRWCHLAGERKDCAAELQSVAKSAAKAAFEHFDQRNGFLDGHGHFLLERHLRAV